MVFWQLVDNEIDGLFVAATILDNITNLGQVMYTTHAFMLRLYDLLHHQTSIERMGAINPYNSSLVLLHRPFGWAVTPCRFKLLVKIASLNCVFRDFLCLLYLGLRSIGFGLSSIREYVKFYTKWRQW